jgi:hypothetical protein
MVPPGPAIFRELNDFVDVPTTLVAPSKSNE